VAKKTPDYTKQARRSSGRPKGSYQTSRQTGGQARSPQGRTSAARKITAEDTEIPKLILMSSMVSIVGGAFIFLWGLVMTLPQAGVGGLSGRGAVVASIGMFCGVACNVCMAIMLLRTYDPRKYRFGALSMRTMIYAFIGTGILAFVIIFSWGTGGMMTFGLALAPAVIVFYFVLKPRLKARAVVDGRYKPNRRESARQEYEREMAARKAEKEHYKRLKEARLGTGKAAQPAKASASGKTASSGRGTAGAKGRPQA
jgi:hypothetical protein